MVKRWGIVLALASLLCLVMLTAAVYAVPVSAQTDGEAQVAITSPTSGAQLFGRVTVSGSAYHPSAFASYTLEFNDLREPAVWSLFSRVVQGPVTNDVLGEWDTTQIQDGTYQLRLRLFLTNGETYEAVVTNLEIRNTEPPPIPTAIPQQTEPLASDSSGTVEIVPTIAQPQSIGVPEQTVPDSAAPQANPSAGLTVDTSGDADTKINLGRVQDAFCVGAYVGMGAFAAMLGYAVLRKRIRLHGGQTWHDYNNE